MASCLRLPFPCRCPCRQSKAVAASCASRRAGRGGFGPVGRRPAPLSFRRLARPTRARCVVLRPGVGSAENSCSRSWWRRALRPAPCSACGHCFGRVGGVGRSSARRLAPFPPRGAFAPPPFPRRALFGPPMRYFFAGGWGFALGPRLRRVVAGGARALPRRLLCGRLRLRLRGLRPLPRPVRPRCAGRPGRLVAALRALSLAASRMAVKGQAAARPLKPSRARRRAVPAGRATAVMPPTSAAWDTKSAGCHTHPARFILAWAAGEAACGRWPPRRDKPSSNRHNSHRRNHSPGKHRPRNQAGMRQPGSAAHM